MKIEGPIIACVPVKPIAGAPPYKHTHFPQRACDVCKEAMYVGPRSAALHAEKGLPLICMFCAVRIASPVVDVRSLGGA